MKIQIAKKLLIALSVCAVAVPAVFSSQDAWAKSKKTQLSSYKSEQTIHKKSDKSSKRGEKRNKKNNDMVVASENKKLSRRSKKSTKRSVRRPAAPAAQYVRYVPSAYPSHTCDQYSPSILNTKASPYNQLIQFASRTHGVNPNLIKAVITAETCFNPTATSPKGAKGLMQLMPATGRRFGVTSRNNPFENIYGGTMYLRWLLNRYGGSVPHAVAAYNSGEGTVDKYGLGVPYRETQNYTRQVMNAFRKLSSPNQYQAQQQQYQQRWEQQQRQQQYQQQAQQQRQQQSTQAVSNGTPNCNAVPGKLYQNTQVVNRGHIRMFYYKVGEYENLYQAAWQTGMDANQIKAYNNLQNANLRPNMTLKVAQCTF